MLRRKFYKLENSVYMSKRKVVTHPEIRLGNSYKSLRYLGKKLISASRVYKPVFRMKLVVLYYFVVLRCIPNYV